MSSQEDFKPYKHDMMGDHYAHPTFGTISISRGQGTPRPMFGSSILHSETIRLIISHAELTRDLKRDRIFEHDRIVEVDMSPTQFADAITSLNVGGGTPVTIRWISKSDGENLFHTEPPYQNKVQQFNSEFETDMEGLAKRFDSVIALANQTNAQKRLIKELELLRQTVASNIPFVTKSFSEQMEKTVTEAKGEVEAFVRHTVEAYGIEAIKKQAPQLPEVTAEVKEITEGSHGESTRHS